MVKPMFPEAFRTEGEEGEEEKGQGGGEGGATTLPALPAAWVAATANPLPPPPLLEGIREVLGQIHPDIKADDKSLGIIASFAKEAVKKAAEVRGNTNDILLWFSTKARALFSNEPRLFAVKVAVKMTGAEMTAAFEAYKAEGDAKPNTMFPTISAAIPDMDNMTYCLHLFLFALICVFSFILWL